MFWKSRNFRRFILEKNFEFLGRLWSSFFLSVNDLRSFEYFLSIKWFHRGALSAPARISVFQKSFFWLMRVLMVHFVHFSNWLFGGSKWTLKSIRADWAILIWEQHSEYTINLDITQSYWFNPPLYAVDPYNDGSDSFKRRFNSVGV